MDAIREGRMQRAMLIGKGSLFLGRLTNLADGASFIVEKPVAQPAAAAVDAQDVRAVLLEVMEDMAGKLKG